MVKNRTAFILRIFLSLVFFLSAYSKLIAPGLLEIILVDHGIVSTRETAAILVRLLIGFEFSLALLLLQKNYLRVILSAVTGFLTVFTFYLGYAAIGLKDSQNCGCFGAVVQMSPVESIFKNLFLIIITFILLRISKNEGKRIILPLVLFFVSFPAVFLLSPIKDNKEFIFSRYTEFINGGRVDMSEGEKLVLLMTLDCDHCQKAAKDIIALNKKYRLPDTYALFFQEGNVTVDSFKVLTGFNSPYKVLPGEEFFEMIGSSPPRCYRLKDGKVLEFWDKDIKEMLEERYKK